MTYRKFLVVVGMVLVACQTQVSEAPRSVAPASSPPSLASPTPPIDEDLVLLTEEFRALRPIAGQFSGGQWDDEVDQWQGKKHRVMLALEERLGDGSYGRSQLTTLLGPADFIVTGGDALFEQIQSLPEYETFAPSDEFLIYEWRGTHDFLFFASQQDRIIASGWWYAGE